MKDAKYAHLLKTISGGRDLADIQPMNKYNKRFRFLLCVIDIFSKYAENVHLKNRKCTTITNAFQKILGECNLKHKKIWVDKDSESYNRSIKSWFQDNATEMPSTLNDEKSAVAENVVRNIKNKIYKCMTSISKKLYINKLVNIVNEYNNTYHSTIKIKPGNIKSNA